MANTYQSSFNGMSFSCRILDRGVILVILEFDQLLGLLCIKSLKYISAREELISFQPIYNLVKLEGFELSTVYLRHLSVLYYTYSRTSMARTSFGPWKGVLAKGSSSHPVWIMHSMTCRGHGDSSSQPRWMSHQSSSHWHSTVYLLTTFKWYKNDYFRIWLPQWINMLHQDSVVECLTQDRGAAGSSITGITVLCPWERHIYPCLVLVQPRKTHPAITVKLLTET